MKDFLKILERFTRKGRLATKERILRDLLQAKKMGASCVDIGLRRFHCSQIPQLRLEVVRMRRRMAHS